MGEFFQCKIPNIDGFIADFERVQSELNPAIEDALDKGAKIIEQEQKRIISQKSRRLARHISFSKNQTKKGKKYRAIGYMATSDDKFAEDILYGIVLEFGRPGKAKNKGTIKRKVKGKTYTVINGYIPEYSHIRRGFDNKIDEANGIIDGTFNKIVDKLGD